MSVQKSINGKILLFTDLHLGLQGNSVSKLNIAVRAVKEILDYVKKNNIKNIFFLGDWNHSRVTTENNVLNVSYKLMQALQKFAHVTMIVGNHDIYMKNSNDINSLVIFKDLANVSLVGEVTQMSINGQQAILVPWLGDVSCFKKDQFDMMFGHFEVSSKFLIKSYIDEHQNKLSAQGSLKDEIDKSLGSKEQNVGDLVGDFVDVVKRDSGTIFSGHIHTRKEFIAKGRNFIFVGSPYQQNLGEKDCTCGFYVINEDNSYEFHEILSTPKHIQIQMSEAVNDNYNFSKVKNNIVQKVYDIDVDPTVDTKIAQKISDMKPYEEMLPEYTVLPSSSISCDDNSSKSIELLKKSKLEYIRNYIQNIDDEALKDDGLERDKLFGTLEKYYNEVI